jgi:predicted nucleic acid-binding protein
MKYVVDASVALKWVLPEIDSPIAQRLQSETAAGHHRLVAPDFFSVEVAHSLTRAERKGFIAIGDAEILMWRIIRTLPILVDSMPLLFRAIAISSSHRQGLYDCLYVALAEQERCELVTADDKLVKKLQPHFPFILPLSSLP